MRTVAIISQKGGAGKTTLALHLATAGQAFGLITLAIDTDPQATLSRWSGWRLGREPEVIDCGAPSLLDPKLRRAEELGAELAIIDTPPHAAKRPGWPTLSSCPAGRRLLTWPLSKPPPSSSGPPASRASWCSWRAHRARG